MNFATPSHIYRIGVLLWPTLKSNLSARWWICCLVVFPWDGQSDPWPIRSMPTWCQILGSTVVGCKAQAGDGWWATGTDRDCRDHWRPVVTLLKPMETAGTTGDWWWPAELTETVGTTGDRWWPAGINRDSIDIILWIHSNAFCIPELEINNDWNSLIFGACNTKYISTECSGAENIFLLRMYFFLPVLLSMVYL